jgi:hypothetical protein
MWFSQQCWCTFLSSSIWHHIERYIGNSWRSILLAFSRQSKKRNLGSTEDAINMLLKTWVPTYQYA